MAVKPSANLGKAFQLPHPFNSCVYIQIPPQPTWSINEYWERNPNKQYLDESDTTYLEELTLTPIEKHQALEKLNTIISAADRLQEVDTKNVDPMYTCVDEREMYMNSGQDGETVNKEEILGNAHKIFQDYFTAPTSEKMRSSSDLNAKE
ncbi:Glutamyl-tRNA(Gln) amidotransferase subunit C, mitochondrial [Trichoplax sp. H2]|uniref:Glutamyl-tRNA(Gln) amidotransferase subunit C, mitochondrial n=1 Tax=Trichoplax adhaerens TaxID=10228 RepID=GATC_TRIAD|nr:hypothetical protein TRIADDRAFT_57266 [Trichoplax adhaerens]B3RYZ0.1 RecName: Full=Glutamyl-tRNA(Gln) amidotransferase subunit C, mitochondrial; Short=Glu-AdT subunit C [Trichoplax adhaerens]EDV24110.1 hypothetical protein TRIADDRAFT_57266 [Trichoplax adhaerens]RDD40717.1 Glutamyl-tRNA(Gln) amidotransferase subunit C, mitochondrial [Trichoplax sp. H2]|eukprot:XP_002113636.1 hypothetical protein TRIADDRAFT_57266 [Trichoplax adhaerens]